MKYAMTLAVAACALAGCGGEPAATEVDATYFVAVPFQSDMAFVSSLYSAPRGVLPDMKSAVLEVNGTAIPFDTDVAARPGQDAGFQFSGNTAAVDETGAYVFTIGFPGQPGTTLSIPMVKPSAFITPAASEAISIHEDLKVSWIPAQGSQDSIVLTDHKGNAVELDAPVDHASVVIPASKLEETFAAITAPTQLQLGIVRSRTRPNNPPFAGGTTRLQAEVTQIQLLLQP